MGVDGAVRGDSSSHGGDEARDAAGEVLVEGIGIAFGRSGIEADSGCDKGACDGGERGGCGSSEATRNHAVEGANLIMRLKAWEITQSRMRIWGMTSYVKQLMKVNYGIVVGLTVAKSELRRLRKAECDVQRNKSTTVVKNNLRLVKDLVTEKIGIEVSRQADSERWAVKRVDVECLAAGDCRPIGQ